ncbi:MAG TPA: hypothetical protein VFB21_04925 [Chthonomonadaceae bacterium]|jgi:hypothetical protein|nr:hypothetical protein [Chthonomonadaceae bacterium]
MWVIVSEDYCVVQYGGAFYVCRRMSSGKLERLCECASYQEAEQAYRQFRNSL